MGGINGGVGRVTNGVDVIGQWKWAGFEWRCGQMVWVWLWLGVVIMGVVYANEQGLGLKGIGWGKWAEFGCRHGHDWVWSLWAWSAYGRG